MTHLPWVALHGMAHSFIELHKAVIHVIRLVSFCDCGFHSVHEVLKGRILKWFAAPYVRHGLAIQFLHDSIQVR